MTYTAFSDIGPRIALAVSDDLFTWTRLGLARFLPTDDGVGFAGVADKDAVLFPEPLVDPNGRLSLAMMHRPLYKGTLPLDTARLSAARRLDLERESICISYSPIEKGHESFCYFTSHRRLAAPRFDWERLKIGSGAPPVRLGSKFALIYHGVAGDDIDHPNKFSYSAGLMMLDATHETNHLPF